MTKTFRNLPAQQDSVLQQICLGNDGGHNPATLEALERKGLIEMYQSEDREGGFRFFTNRYYVPMGIHIEWCRWCAEVLE
jgi:hypothetical protein